MTTLLQDNFSGLALNAPLIGSTASGVGGTWVIQNSFWTGTLVGTGDGYVYCNAAGNGVANGMCGTTFAAGNPNFTISFDLRIKSLNSQRVGILLNGATTNGNSFYSVLMNFATGQLEVCAATSASAFSTPINQRFEPGDVLHFEVSVREGGYYFVRLGGQLVYRGFLTAVSAGTLFGLAIAGSASTATTGIHVGNLLVTQGTPTAIKVTGYQTCLPGTPTSPITISLDPPGTVLGVDTVITMTDGAVGGSIGLTANGVASAVAIPAGLGSTCFYYKPPGTVTVGQAITLTLANNQSLPNATRVLTVQGKCLVCAGDSTTFGTPLVYTGGASPARPIRDETSWPVQLEPSVAGSAGSGWAVINSGTGGATVASYTTSLPTTVDPYYDATRSANVCVVLLGINDINNNAGVTGYPTNTFVPAYFALLDALVARGWQVIAATLPHSAANNALYITASAAIRAGWRQHAHGLWDRGANSFIGSSGPAGTSNAYSPDGVHETEAGYAEEAKGIQGALGSLSAIPTAGGGGAAFISC